MQGCAVCGNVYDKPIEVKASGKTFVFDCFECAIHKLAPTCSHCQCRIIGHGVEAFGKIYCGSHCAKEQGVTGLVDRKQSTK